jgi:long-chain fatty acid transport protein
MIDGGLVNLSAGNPLGLPMGGQGTVSDTNNDIFAQNTADDWAFGFNLGLMYEFTKDTRVGLAYRSEVKHKLKGDIKTDVPATMAGLASLFQSQGISGTITLPAVASFNIFSQITDKLALMGDVTWTGWSSFDKLTINFEGAGIAGNTSTTTTENWDDRWRYSLGLSYQLTEALKLRGGVAFDETPISDDYRTPRIPGEDRTWVSIGAGYQLSESIYMDFAYAHLFVPDAKMQKYASNPEDTARGTVVGEFENSVDIASIQLSYSF